MTLKKLLLFAGDGIGIEIMSETLKFISYMNDDLKLNIKWEQGLVGGAALDAYGIPISDEDMDRALSADAILLGAVGCPKWEKIAYEIRPEAGLLRLRKELELFANLRPIVCYPALVEASSLKNDLVKGLDILIVRELTGGIYFGEPKEIVIQETGKKRAVDTQIYHSDEIERIARTAFELARTRNKHVTSIEKRNVMKTGILWHEIIVAIHAAHYSDIQLTHMLADAGCMQLVRAPKQFDVIVTDNLFGDLLSDTAAMLTGSLGMLPSASLGPFMDKKNVKRRALYEPVHGSAPDIAGLGLANPIAMIASLAMCLRYSFSLHVYANCLEQAISNILDYGLRTADISSSGIRRVSTSEMGEAILREFKKNVETARAYGSLL